MNTQPDQQQENCHRTACNNPHAWWWNKATEAFYCEACKKRIAQYPENANLFERRPPETHVLFTCSNPACDVQILRKKETLTQPIYFAYCSRECRSAVESPAQNGGERNSLLVEEARTFLRDNPPDCPQAEHVRIKSLVDELAKAREENSRLRDWVENGADHHPGCSGGYGEKYADFVNSRLSCQFSKNRNNCCNFPLCRYSGNR